jgi:tetratricopeptide (TPR) repeat protein
MKGIFKDENTFNQPLENWNLTFQANIDMGDVKRIQKEYQAATTYYSKAIEIEPKNALGYKKRAEVKQFTENFKGAVADLTKSIELNPNNPDSYELRGLFKEELREFEGAILDYKKAIELEHDTKKIDRYNFNIKTAILKMEGKDEIEILREQLIKKGIDPDAQIDLKGIAALLNANKKAMNATNEQLTDIERIELHNNLKDRKTDKTNNLIEENAKEKIDGKIVGQDYYIKNEFFKEIAGREEIKVNWLQGIGPIYSWSDKEAFKPNSLFHKPKTDNDGEFMCILCDSIEEAKMIINHILVLNVGKNAYDKIERDGWDHYFNGDLFHLGYRIPEPDDQRILVEINRHEKFDKKNKQINNSNASKEVSEHSSSRRFASGWTVNELKAAYWFEQSIFTAYPETNEKEDYRQRVIIEFIQMAFKNTYNINTIIENKDWTLFSLNLLENENYDLEESLSLLMEMDERKRLELLFIFYQLISLTNQLIENSYENESEIELITSEFHNLNSLNEKMLQVKLTEEEYHNIYEKYCEEDDRQNRDN